MSDHGSAVAAESFVVHVVSHTHWDREWYLPASRFRQRLVALVDELLDDPPCGGASFLLDGQTILLDDYLAVRPERGAHLTAMLRGRVLEAGPWFVLADELIPGGEALVRNLLAGRATLAAHGAEAPPVLYCPDSFGHPACLPLLAREFGLGLVILWRGYGGTRWPAGDAAFWEAPDGSRVLVHHLPPGGYELGANLPTDSAGARQRWKEIGTVLVPRARLGVSLLLNGADHHARQDELLQALGELGKAAQPTTLRASSLHAFASDMMARAHDALPVVRGELRDSYGYTWTLGGTLATRAAQKRRNAGVERLLVREAEPWAALARRQQGRDFAPLVHAAWRTLLEVHPHDTLCGCSTDEVARAADARLDSAAAQATGIRDDAIDALIGHDAERAREAAGAWHPSLVIRNPVARRRGGIAHVELSARITDVAVGPGSGEVNRAATRRTHGELHVGSESLAVQVLERQERIERIDSARQYPDADLIDWRRALVWVPPVAGYGTTSYDVLGGAHAGATRLRDSNLFRSVRADGLRLINEYLSVSCDDAGRVGIETELVQLDDLIGFEHQADLGDLYTPSLRGRPITSARLRRQRLLHRGPLRAAVEQSWTLRVPGGAASRRPVDIPIVCTISVDAGAPFVRISLHGSNTVRDHRLRIMVRSGITNAAVLADAAFGAVARTTVMVEAEEAAMERPLATAPMHRWVAAHDEARSVTLISDGLAEYEVTPDGAIALTLVRGVGELSRTDLPERPGHAGWPAATPEAQCRGAFEAEMAVFPSSGLDNETLIAIERATEDVLLPLRGHTLRSALQLPMPTSGVELHGEGLAFSAVKDSRIGEWTVLRCVNLLGRETRGEWRSGFPIREARLSRLDETPADGLSHAPDRVSFTVPSRGVSTVLVR